jgi:HK97 family phage major capsid protein
MEIEVTHEPLTYEPGAPQSYFRDLALTTLNEDRAALERLERHAAELRVELPKREARIRAELERRSTDLDGPLTGLEYRTNPSRTDGQGGYFAPPLWLIDQFATAPRVGRVLSRLAPNFALPQGAASVSIPRLTTGTLSGAQPDNTPSPGRDVVDASVTSGVVTIAGQGDVSMQLLEQSAPGAHLDAGFFKDLMEDYVAQLETQLINGSGTGVEADTQLQGLLSVVQSANKISYTSGSPSATGMFTFLGQTVAAVGNNRKQPPECWLMTTSRLAWLGSSEDTQNRPLMITDRDGSGNLDLLSFDVELDDAIPTTLSTNQDRIIATRPSDMIVLESEPRASVMKQVLSGTLQARLQIHGYAAALLGRYPSATAYLQGTGMAVQSGF